MIAAAFVTALEQLACRMHSVLGVRPDYVAMRRSTWTLIKTALCEEYPTYLTYPGKTDAGCQVTGLAVILDETVPGGCFVVGYAQEAVA